MRLRNVRRSSNVVDRRGGGGGRPGTIRGGLGVVGILVVLIIGYMTGIDVTPVLQDATAPRAPQQQETTAPDPATTETADGTGELGTTEEQAADFAARVLATTEDVWGQVFPLQIGADYVPPKLVLFSGVTQSACGGASGATGPFYCPTDQSAYLDTAFFAVLAEQLGAEGDFAAAYVIAHEVAHHVQDELGILGRIAVQRERSDEAQSNALSVRTELQADCLAGVWASGVEGLLEPGDLEEALGAAARVGDDYLARRAGQVPNPHEFSHGTSEQRARWFRIGHDSGDMESCDTFNAAQL